MHQGQQSSLPNCEAVQRGAKLLRLDCAAGGEQGGGEEARRCCIRREVETKSEIQVGWQRVGGLELKAEQRGGDAEPNLLPHGASTFHPFVFSPLFSTSFASHSPSPRWSSGPLVWRRYKANARARLPSVWCRLCQNCHSIIFLVLCCLSKQGQRLPLY